MPNERLDDRDHWTPNHGDFAILGCQLIIEDGNGEVKIMTIPKTFNQNIIDLTLPIASGTPSYPGEPGGYFLPFASIESQGFVAHQLVLYTHLGTHVDAPGHFVPGGHGVDAWDLERLCGPAMVVRLRSGAPRELQHGDLEWPRAPRAGDRVILVTGWDSHWGTEAYFSGFPVVSEELAQYLVQSEVAMLALDTPTPHDQKAPEVHNILLGASIVVVEGVARAQTISENYGTIICLPLPLVGLDGSPARVIFIPWQDGEQ